MLFLKVFFAVNTVIIAQEYEESKWLNNLNGDWKFKLFREQSSIKPSIFSKINFNDSPWDDIKVPGNWEMQGFEVPHYGRSIPDSVVGVYRRKFSLPKAWKEKNVVLTFEGVAYGFELWLNGKNIGFFESPYNRSQFNITHFVQFDEPNALVLKVYRDFPHKDFDYHDSWALSGIFRDVYLSALPMAHIEDYMLKTIVKDSTQATLSGDIIVNHFYEDKFYIYNYEQADLPELSLDVELSYRDNLIATANKKVYWIDDYRSPSPVSFSFNIEQPHLWNAETPQLYDLKIKLKEEDKFVHQITKRVGLREVTIENGILNLNGSPIKMRGVGLHELHWDTGMAVTNEQRILDIKLMKEANINTVRCSHYPPNPHLLEVCDELGIYVLNEIPLNTNRKLDNPGFLAAILSRTQLSFDRDKNSTSNILWCFGNEHTASLYINKGAKFLKMLDSTRPVLYPGGNLSYEDPNLYSGIPDFLDVFSIHYSNTSHLEALKNNTSIRYPILITEYNHSSGQAFGALAEKWDIMQRSDKFVGGIIWHWMDQGIRREVNGNIASSSNNQLSKNSEKDNNTEDFLTNVLDPYISNSGFKHPHDISTDFWLDEKTVLDGRGEFGNDGLVFADRTPSVDFYQTKKVYTPIKILEESVTLKNADADLSITCVNHYDFISTDKAKFLWKITSNNKEIASFESKYSIAARDTAKINVPGFQLPKLNNSENLLHLEVVDHNNRMIYEHTIKLLSDSGVKNYWNKSDNDFSSIKERFESLKAKKVPDEIVLSGDDKATLKINPEGTIQFLADNKVQMTGPYLRVGRKPNVSERKMYREQLKSKFWEPAILKNAKLEKMSYYETAEDKFLMTIYEFHRPDNPKETILLSNILTIKQDGSIDYHYELNVQDCTDYFLELGVTFLFSPIYNTIKWLGDGPYNSYPHKHELAIRGFYSMPKSNTYIFEGNRAKVDVIALKGNGEQSPLWVCNAANVSFGKIDEQITLSHNVGVSGMGTRFKAPKKPLPASELGIIQDSFKIFSASKANTKYPFFD